MSLPLDVSITTNPEAAIDSASAEHPRFESLASHDHTAPIASHGLTASHALAEAKAHKVDEAPVIAGENNGHGESTDTEVVFQPHVLGMSKEDVWVRIRRFNMLVFRVKATKSRPLTNFDMGPTEEGETSPEQLQAQLARLYVTVLVGLFAFYKQMARLRSWNDPQRTSKFLSVYLAAWLVNLLAPTLFLFLIVMIISPASRPVFFPPTPPSIVDATTGGAQKPPAGVVASETTITGAPETHKGEAVEQEAHTFITSFSKLIMSITSDKNPDNNAPEDDPSPGIAKLSGKIANAKSKTDQDGQESNTEKTEEPMKHAIEDFNPQPLLDIFFEFIDIWERLGNVLNPVSLFPGDDSRLLLAGCIAVPTLITLYFSRDTMIKSLELVLGFIFFGEPAIRRGCDFLDREFPSWRNYYKLRNTVLKGVPTNAQLAITVLRVGERISAPVPPPPVSKGSPKMEATANSDGVTELGAIDEETEEDTKTDDSGQDGNDGQRSKNIERVMGFFKHSSKRAVKMFHKTDKLRASRGNTHAQARLDLGQTTREVPDAGPYKFPARYNGAAGYLHLATTAATPSVAWRSHDERLETAWAIMINDIEDISKVDGMSFKTKHFVQWALDKESVMGLKLTTLRGECYHLDPVVKRDEVFNRLIAMGNQIWEVC